MATICKTPKNLTDSPCKFEISEASSMLFISKYGSDGNENFFASESEVNRTTILQKINAPKWLDRLYYFKNIKNYTDERSEPVTEQFNDGSVIEVRQGDRKISFIFPLAHMSLINKFKSWQGVDFGIYFFDTNGSFIYSKGSNDEVKPIPVESNSLSVRYVPATGGNSVNKIEVSFNIAPSFDDSTMRYIPSNQLDFDGNNDLYGLYSTKQTLTSPSADTINDYIITEYNIPVEGLTVSDFSVTNAGGTTYTIDSVTENPSGNYVIVLTSGQVSSGDIVYVKPSKERFEFEAANVTMT